MATELKQRRTARLRVTTSFDASASESIAGEMNAILADVFALFLKTKNFHWHMSGPHFRDYHLLLDDRMASIYTLHTSSNHFRTHTLKHSLTTT